MDEKASLQMQNLEESAVAGSSLFGELSITAHETISNLELEIFLAYKENVDFRTQDLNTTCTDKIVKNKKQFGKVLFKYATLHGTTNIKFELDLAKDLPAACQILTNGDLGKIAYEVKAVLKSQNFQIAKCSKQIRIIPYLTGTQMLEHSIQLRGCCFNYGTVTIFSNFSSLGWKINDVMNISLTINNTKSSASIIQVNYELWKKIHLRDNNKNTETSTVLVTRGLESVSIGPSGALTSESNVGIKINLREVQEKIEGHVSTIADFINCEYSLKFVLTAKTCCGKMQASFIRPLTIHF
jgi:hypothetical protein